MGWNDRLPNDPNVPPPEYYRDREEYEAWLEYVEAKLTAADEVSLTSQNIDPATLASQPPPQETPSRQGLLPRLWAMVFGQNTFKTEKQEENKNTQNGDVEVPF